MGTTTQRALRPLLLASMTALACTDEYVQTTALPAATRPPQAVVLLITPKAIPDFEQPAAGVAAILQRYAPLTTRAAETIIIFAVGNSEHVLMYRGTEHWNDAIEWARYTEGLPVSDRVLDYRDVDRIVKEFKAQGQAAGLTLKVYDQVDQGVEFALEFWKLDRHPECFSLEWESFDIRGAMKADPYPYASAPEGVGDGKNCGRFLIEQTAAYMRDLGFDGVLYANQLGTRGHWLPDNGPGHSSAEENAIRDFLTYSRQTFADRELMWQDSYNNVAVERATWSFPTDAYNRFDYLIASGFAVVTFTGRYKDNLDSKLALPNRPRVLATIDYVDPWYLYKTMHEFREESEWLERIAIERRYIVDGVFLFANDDTGALIPSPLISSFADRFFAD